MVAAVVSPTPGWGALLLGALLRLVALIFADGYPARLGCTVNQHLVQCLFLFSGQGLRLEGVSLLVRTGMLQVVQYCVSLL
mmetsp:Transcript_60716/g.131582  ORF Transcript_60716/g.131582 Transcript_60716/m.131582 type:complete len:81 (+) Transcript_60716:166-408(+)